MKIENFKTGDPPNPNLKSINLDPKDNIKNKKYVRRLLKNIAESSPDNLQENLKNAYHENAELIGFHPVNEIKGIGNKRKRILLHNTACKVEPFND